MTKKQSHSPEPKGAPETAQTKTAQLSKAEAIETLWLAMAEAEIGDQRKPRTDEELLQDLGISFEAYVQIAARLLVPCKTPAAAATQALRLVRACRCVLKLEQSEACLEGLAGDIAEDFGWGEHVSFDEIAKAATSQDRPERARAYLEDFLSGLGKTPADGKKLLEDIRGRGSSREEAAELVTFYWRRTKKTPLRKIVLAYLKKRKDAKKTQGSAKNKRKSAK